MKSLIALGLVPITAHTEEKTLLTKKIKFIHITDSHMDLNNEDSVEAMEDMVSFVNKNYKDLDFILFGGDNFNNNANRDEDAIKFKKIIDTLNCPTYVVRGNKESSPKPKDGIEIDAFKKIFMSDNNLKVDGINWMLEKNDYLILGLDSCIENGNNGLYTKETIAFAKKALDLNKPTIILNHHPYTNYWGGTKKDDIHKYVLNNTEEVQKELFGYKNLLLTLSGHKHIDSITEIQETKVIVTRGFIRPLDLDQYPMRYIEIYDSHIEEKIIYTASV
jgi:Icc protein